MPAFRESIERFRRRLRFAGALREFRRDPLAAVRNGSLLQRLQDDWLNESWSASDAYLREAVERAAGASGPILECGSGLSTILLGITTIKTGRRLVALENDPYWASRTRKWLRFVGATHASVIDAPLVPFDNYDWYDVPPDAIPGEIALIICDGPPGTTRGGRSGLLPQTFTQFAPEVVILLDDAARPAEAATIAEWTTTYGLAAALRNDAKAYAVLRRDTP